MIDFWQNKNAFIITQIAPFPHLFATTHWDPDGPSPWVFSLCHWVEDWGGVRNSAGTVFQVWTLTNDRVLNRKQPSSSFWKVEYFQYNDTWQNKWAVAITYFAEIGLMDYDCRSFPDHEVNVAPFFSEYSTHGVMIVRRNWLWLIFWRVIGKYKILFRSQSSIHFSSIKEYFTINLLI